MEGRRKSDNKNDNSMFKITADKDLAIEMRRWPNGSIHSRIYVIDENGIRWQDLKGL